MKIETAKAITDGAGALAGSTGMITVIMAYLKSNAVVLGLVISFASLIVYVFFQFLYYRKLTLADENKIYMEKMESKFDNDIKKLTTGIDSILDKLSKE